MPELEEAADRTDEAYAEDVRDVQREVCGQQRGRCTVDFNSADKRDSFNAKVTRSTNY